MGNGLLADACCPRAFSATKSSGGPIRVCGGGTPVASLLALVVERQGTPVTGGFGGRRCARLRLGARLLHAPPEDCAPPRPANNRINRPAVRATTRSAGRRWLLARSHAPRPEPSGAYRGTRGSSPRPGPRLLTLAEASLAAGPSGNGHTNIEGGQHLLRAVTSSPPQESLGRSEAILVSRSPRSAVRGVGCPSGQLRPLSPCFVWIWSSEVLPAATAISGPPRQPAPSTSSVRQPSPGGRSCGPAQSGPPGSRPGSRRPTSAWSAAKARRSSGLDSAWLTADHTRASRSRHGPDGDQPDLRGARLP